jgi:hypothetical protein
MADRNYNAPSTGSSFSIITILFVIIGLLLIYYLYRFLNTSAYSTSTAIIPSQKAANVPPTSIPPFPQPYEGGDYSVNTWIYLNSLNTNNKRKHLLELKGKHFSTLLLGIGAFKNSLVVRTHYKDLTQGFQNPVSDYTNGIVNRVKSIVANGVEGFQSGSGSGSGSAPDPGSGSASMLGSGSASGSAAGSRMGSTATVPTTTVPTTTTTTGPTTTTTSTTGSGSTRTVVITTTTTTTPNSSDLPGTLSTGQIDAMFKPMASDDSLLAGVPIQCDIAEIDLQRWTMITVVLSGKTIDVYIDGKLVRSCVTPSYFKVDPTADVKLNMLDRGGFDGYVGNTTVGSYSMNPDEIYKTYMSGPNGVSLDVFSWIASLFRGAKLE